jgi:formylmethanofuran dehydrogenase subunit E
VPRGKELLSQEEADKAFRDADFTPLEPYTGSSDKRKAKCEVCGSICFVAYASVRRGRRGCKTCKAELMRKARLMDVDVVDAVFVAAGMEPLEPYKGANVARKCRCLKCGTIGSPRYGSLQSGKGGCRPCGYEIVRTKLRSQKTNLAAIDAVFERANVTPLEPWVNANTPRLSRCNVCGNEARIRYGNLWSGQGGCRPCAAKARGLAQRNPDEVVDAVFRDHNLEPLEPYPGTDVKRRCRCLDCGATVETMYKEIAAGKRSGCRFCGYAKLGKSMMLPEQLVDALFAAKGLEPLEPYAGASVPRRCRCTKCDREVSPQYASLKQGQGGCKFCAPVGLQRAAPGILYLMRHEAFCALKIGVSSTEARRNRIKAHEDSGWELVRSWDLADAALAETVETVMLSHWRKTLGAPPALLPSDMPQGGYSETVAMLHTTEDEASRFVDIVMAQIIDPTSEST